MAMKFLRLGLVLGILVGCSGSQVPPAEPASTAEAPPAAPLSSVPAEAAPANAPEPKTPVAVAKADYGTVDGKTVQLYTLTNKNGLVMKVTNYGTIITELHVPDKAGKFDDIVLGYSTVDEYVKATPYFGATVGRIANRIKNAEFKQIYEHGQAIAKRLGLEISDETFNPVIVDFYEQVGYLPHAIVN